MKEKFHMAGRSEHRVKNLSQKSDSDKYSCQTKTNSFFVDCSFDIIFSSGRVWVCSKLRRWLRMGFFKKKNSLLFFCIFCEEIVAKDFFNIVENRFFSYIFYKLIK